ncbi:MAG: hypothetical protein IJX99_03005 [Clostridia bacterium]|nr:hypothetical protein [Clostridia bacterium]
MDNIETNVQSIELQKHIQKLEKLERMINPNSKKAMILWEEDDAFKNLISDLREYALNCDTAEFPVELLDKMNALQLDATNQITLSATKIDELKQQIQKNKDLGRLLSDIYIAAMAAEPIMSKYAETLEKEEIATMKEHLETISTAVADSEEYLKAEKIVKAKISNLENSVHVTTDLERATSKVGALEYIKAELTPAVERLQAEYDAKYVIIESSEDTEMALAIRKTFKEKVYDAIVKPFASLFKKKNKIKE